MTPPSAPETKTLLLTDIAGSSDQWECDHQVMGASIARHDEIVRSAVEASGGRLIKHKGEGDSTFSVFEAADDAVAAAVHLQRAMASEPWPTREPLRVRIGIHTGEVEARDGDYYGRAVNRAARVRALGEGATIILTAASATLAADELPAGAALVDLGEHRLRGIAGAERLFAVAHADLPDPNVALGHLQRRSGPAVPAALRIWAPEELVDRERELAVVRDAWRQAASGRASLALVSGEPGVGKTRLAGAVAEHASESGSIVLYGRCDEEPLRPYQPFGEALGAALDQLSGSEISELTEDVAADLALLLPELRARTVVRGNPASERFVLFEAVATFLTRLAAGRPVLLVLDDLQWADEPSLGLLRHVLRSRPGSPVLVVGTYRDTDVDDERSLVTWLVRFRREVPTVEVHLRGLGRAGVGRLLGETHRQHLDAVWSACDGNPFFVIELRRQLAADADVGVPQPVRQSVADRVLRLPPPTRRFVHAAAVAGVDVDVPVAALAAGVAPEAANPSVLAGILTAVPEAGSPLRFGHELIRAAVLDDLPPVARADLHRRVAGAIEELHAERIDRYAARLAYHHIEAGDRTAQGPAYAWSLRAGRLAGRQLAYEEAEEHHRAAADIAAHDGDTAGRITAELELAEVLRRSGRPATGLQIARSAADSASEIGAADLAGWGTFATRFGQALGAPGNLASIGEARSRLDPDSPWRGPLDALQAGELMHVGEVDAGLDLLRATTERARAAGDWSTLVIALTASHMYVDRLLTPVDEILAAVERLDEDAAPSLSLSAGVLRVQCESLRIGELVTAGDVAGARDVAASFTTRYGEETGMTEANVPLFALSDALLCGRWDEWQLRLDRFQGDPELASGFASHLLGCQLMAAWVGGRLGMYVEAIESAPASMMLVRPAVALALAEAARPADARRVLTECAADDGLEARARTVFGRSELALLGAAAAEAGDGETAAKVYELLRPRTGQVVAWAGWAFWGAVDGIVGVLASACGRPDRAVDHLEAARDLYERAGWRVPMAIAGAQLAGSLLERGLPGDATRAQQLVAETLPEARGLRLAGVERRLAAVGAGLNGGTRPLRR